MTKKELTALINTNYHTARKLFESPTELVCPTCFKSHFNLIFTANIKVGRVINNFMVSNMSQIPKERSHIYTPMCSKKCLIEYIYFRLPLLLDNMLENCK